MSCNDMQQTTYAMVRSNGVNAASAVGILAFLHSAGVAVHFE